MTEFAKCQKSQSVLFPLVLLQVLSLTEKKPFPGIRIIWWFGILNGTAKYSFSIVYHGVIAIYGRHSLVTIAPWLADGFERLHCTVL